ncbi:hypothetical protein [Nocardia sp. SSK8]|uniref:hypothetical protein n=1 Tax=Nocardia sp. SSK8 TaxID=3120154 RepID=UPI00300B4BC3
MKEQEPILDVARGDAAVSRQVGDALRTIARGTGDPALRRQISDILAGRSSARDLANGDAFNRLLDAAVPDALAKYHAMSDEERAREVEQGRAELERTRRELEREAAAEASAAKSGGPSGDPYPQSQQHAPSNQHVISGTRKPNRDRVVTPDDLDEDDLYFQERNQRGWLS